MLEPFVSLQSGHFSRALFKCVLRTRVIPDVVRSDRGPEMVSKVNEEFLAICNARHKLGAALTPRHQGLCERDHQVMIGNQNVLMQAVCKAQPQEWPAMIPVGNLNLTKNTNALRLHPMHPHLSNRSPSLQKILYHWNRAICQLAIR